jgi:hypothetical protein
LLSFFSFYEWKQISSGCSVLVGIGKFVLCLVGVLLEPQRAIYPTIPFWVGGVLGVCGEHCSFLVLARSYHTIIDIICLSFSSHIQMNEKLSFARNDTLLNYAVIIFVF